jgi:predicted nucleotidyltransferase
VWGLGRVACNDPELSPSFVAGARSRKESADVRVAYLSAVQGSLGKDPAVKECWLACLDDSEALAVRRFAAQGLAEALAAGSLPWSPEVVAQAEAVLMSVTNPCPHSWHALLHLLDAKEARGGSRLERVLGAALVPFDDRIVTALVFGSVARREQHPDSDIDLFLMGDVRLKEVAAALHAAEGALGRVINPVLYTPAAFRQKHQAGDPFLLEVVRNEKIFLKGNLDELRELVAERSSE